MARLRRSKLGRDRYQECVDMTALAFILALRGERNLFLCVGAYSLLLWARYEELVAPTTIEGIRYDFFEVIGGFDFKELFRFEKQDFLELLTELEVPDLEISR